MNHSKYREGGGLAPQSTKAKPLIPHGLLCLSGFTISRPMGGKFLTSAKWEARVKTNRRQKPRQ